MELEELARKEDIEIEYWATSESENPNNFSIGNLLNKMSEAGVFVNLIGPYETIFNTSEIILEIGAGQGWASCIIKSKFNKKVIVSDISQHAIDSVKYWEDIFKIKLDQTFTCRAYDIPLEDGAVDLIFCFAAAHHFREHQKALLEIRRVLKPGGKCIYLYEPSCIRFWYKMAYKRVNKKRPHVPEDVLVIKDMVKYATDAGLKTTVDYCFSTTYRGPQATLYYMILKRFPFLARIFPCTCNYIFEKI